MIFRHAIASDAPAIAHLHAESWRSAYRGILSDDFLEHHVHEERRQAWQTRFSGAGGQPFFVLVAENAGQIAGFACVFPMPEDHAVFGSYLDNLHVCPGITGQGIGRSLLSQVARCLQTSGSSAGLYLWVIEQNYRAREFYKKAGAVDAGSEVHSMPDGQSVLGLRCHWPDSRRLLR